MKNIKNLTALFEQTSTETKFKLLAPPTTKPAGDGSTRIEWQYRFSWPAANPLLGDVKELINTINKSTEGDAKLVLSAIKGSDRTHEVGIARAEESSQKNRIIGKDLGEFTGWIYLFYPDTINTQAIPANQKIASGIDNRMTYLVDAKGEFAKYFKEPGTGNAKDTGNEETDVEETDVDENPDAVFTAASFLDQDGPAYDWFYNKKPDGLWFKYISPTFNKIAQNKVPITTSGEIVPLFWSFVSKLPQGLAIAPPGPTGTKEYSQTLKSALSNLLSAAAKYDQSNFSAVNVDVLTKEVYAKLANAVIILGLNAGKINIDSLDFDNTPSNQPYYAPIKAASTESGSLADPSAAGAAGTASGTATVGFDGTAVNTEVDLAKIISGIYVTKYNVAKTDIDTLDKIKARFETDFKSNNLTWAIAISSLPWKKNVTSYSTNATFKYIQINAYGTHGIYGPNTTAAFKKMFDGSAIQ